MILCKWLRWFGCLSLAFTPCTGNNLSHSSWHLPVAWMHAPKTGSSFGLTVYRHACKGIPVDITVGCGPPINALTRQFPMRRYCRGGFISFQRIGGHRPLAMMEDYGHVLSMFREPFAQKASMLAFVYKMARDRAYCRRCGVTPEGPLRSSGMPVALSSEGVAAARNGYHRVLMRVILPRMQGCQTKMIFGFPCLAEVSQRQWNDMLLNVANFVPAAFAFIGLVERWAESICMFHILLEQGNAPLPTEFHNSRPTHDNTQRHMLAKEEWMSHVANNSTDSNFLRRLLLFDPLDDLTYKLASQSFNASIMKAISNMSQMRMHNNRICLDALKLRH